MPSTNDYPLLQPLRMRTWRNDWILIGGGFLLGTIFTTICLGWWPDTGDVNGIPVQPVWRFLWQWQTFITGVFAGAAALIAARSAWLSSQRQINAEDERRRNDANDEWVALTASLANLITAASAKLRNAPERGLSPSLRPVIERALTDVVKIDPRLCFGLVGFLEDVHEHEVARHNLRMPMNPVEASSHPAFGEFKVASEVFAVRGDLLALCLGITSIAMRHGDGVPDELIEAATFKKARRSLSDEQLGWADWLRQPPQQV